MNSKRFLYTHNGYMGIVSKFHFIGVISLKDIFTRWKYNLEDFFYLFIFYFFLFKLDQI